MKRFFRMVTLCLAAAIALSTFPAIAAEQAPSEGLPEIKYMMATAKSDLLRINDKKKMATKAYKCDIYQVTGAEGKYTLLQETSRMGVSRFCIESKKLKAVDASANARYMVRAVGKDVSIYSGPSRQYKVIGTLKSGKIIPRLENYWDADKKEWGVVLTNGKIGFISYEDASLLTGLSELKGYVQAKAKKTVQVYAGPSTKSDRYDGFETIKQASGARSKIGEYGEWTLIKVPDSDSIAYVKTKDVDVMDKSSPVVAYMVAYGPTAVYSGMRGADDVMATLQTGALVPVHGGIGDSVLVVSYGGKLGVVHDFVDSFVFDANPKKKVTAVLASDAIAYSGAGTSFQALHKLASGATVEVLFTYQEWTVVRYKSAVGFVQTQHLNQ